MLSPKRISLLLAATLVASLLVFLVATYNIGETNAAPGTLKARILRRHDKTKLNLTAQEVDSLRNQASPEEERQLEDTIPKHVPIKVKIRAEKEKAFKDLNNEHWLRDLEIEVKNTGTKPIYFLDLQVHLPDTRGLDGNTIGWGLHYGRTDLVEITAPLKPEDVPIRPGETHVFTIAERFVRGWERIVREDNVHQPKKVQVLFQFINFGDGTGFWGTTAAPLPHPKLTANQTGPCEPAPNGSDRKHPTIKWQLIALNHSVRSRWFDALPAFLPANFLSTESSNPVSIDTSLEPDTCCPGTSCIWAKQGFSRCYCSDIDDPEIQDHRVAQFPGCGQSGGACSTITYDTWWCDFPNTDGTTFKLSCQEAFVMACADSNPTPTPSPSPSPTPSPTPTPCPAGSFDPDPNGNCPYYSDKINGCCVCQQRNPTCEGLASDCIWVEHLCDCYNLYGRCGDPTPTPTPGGGGDPGSGTDPNSNPVMYKTDCVDYYWVHFVSYDGGQTWYYNDNETYAGCFYEY